MIDLKFIQFYVESIYNKSIEEYFHVERPTVSNWRKRGMPKRYLLTFIDLEKSDNIFDLFSRIYQKNNIKMECICIKEYRNGGNGYPISISYEGDTIEYQLNNKGYTIYLGNKEISLTEIEYNEYFEDKQGGRDRKINDIFTN